MRAPLPIVFVSLVAVSDLTAQSAGGPCPNVYPSPRVGDYAQMSFRNQSGEGMSIRFAIVGTESVDGKLHYWMEVVTVPPAVGAEVIVQMLVPHYPFEHEDLAGYVVQMPGSPPRNVPRDVLQQMGEQAQPSPGWAEQCAGAVELGTETVTVAAGTFPARHFKAGQAAEIWLADVPFGMVKLVQPDGEMELVSYGSDATSSIKEKPIDLEPPPRPLNPDG